MIASIIAAATALVAVVIGPSVTLRAQKRQFLGPMRQDWINDLRNTVAEFLSEITISRFHMLASNDEPKEVVRAHQAEDRDKYAKICRLCEKVALLINPEEVELQELVRLIERGKNLYHKNEDTKNIEKAIREHTQKVLKAEWNVVKA